MKNIKLPTGLMNIRFITLKTGYAEGVLKPKRQVNAKIKETVIKIRKNEKLIA